MELSLPGEEENCVKDPPLSALGGGRSKVRLREVDRRERRRSSFRSGKEREGIEREGRRPGVAFAPVPGYGYVQPPGL